MNRNHIDSFIPSGTYRKYLADEGIQLTPTQKAKIIYRSQNPLEEKWTALEGLIDEADAPEELKKHIRNYVLYQRETVRTENCNQKDAVYAVYLNDPEDGETEFGIFGEFDTALQIAKRNGMSFRIIRHYAGSYSDVELDEIVQEAQEGIPIDTERAYLSYDEQGRITDCYVIEKDRSDTAYNLYLYADDYLERIFADLPCPFHNGDLIRGVINRYQGMYGIFHLFPDRLEQRKRLIESGFTPDDEELIEFMDENGEFSHAHLMLTDFEAVQSEEIPPEISGVLCSAVSLIQGNGTIDELQYSIYEMRRQKKAGETI